MASFSTPNISEQFETVYFNLKSYTNPDEYIDSELYSKLLEIYTSKFTYVKNNFTVNSEDERLFIDWSKKLFGLTHDSFNLSDNELEEIEDSEKKEFKRVKESLEYVVINIDNYLNDKLNIKFHVDRIISFFDKVNKNMQDINDQMSIMCDKLDELSNYLNSKFTEHDITHNIKNH